MRAAVFAHDGERLLGDCAQFADVLVPFDVQHRPDVQATDGGVRVPRPVRSVSLEEPR